MYGQARIRHGQLVEFLWILSEQRSLEIQKTLATLAQTAGFDS